jgi:subtilisin family serine protease
VTLVAVRVLDNSGSGTTSGVIGGIEYVANMSLGGGFSQALNDAVTAAAGGVLFALAAGNESTDASTRSPASAEHPNIYTVSAIGQDDCLASFSNFGSPVDVAAPGVGVLSTKMGGGTTTFNGTNMAAPHVAGLLLLGTLGSNGTACGDPDGLQKATRLRVREPSSPSR